MSTTGIIIEKTLHFFDHNPNDSNIGKDNKKTENQRNLQNSPEIFDANTSKMTKLNKTQSTSNTTTDNSTEITEEIITPTKNIPYKKFLPTISQTLTNSDT